MTCDGVTDDFDGASRAFAAASHGAFTLVVDCPVLLHMTTDITRVIFLDTGTTVQFSANGKLTVDNVFHPAFVLVNSSNVTLTNWNVEYDASLPVDWDVHGYSQAGIEIVRAGYAQPAFAFNDDTLTKWMTANRAVIFDQSAGSVVATWCGPTNTSAVFFFSGDTSNIQVTGMQLHVPAAAGGDRFIPMAFSFTENYRDNQTVLRNTPATAKYLAVPHGLTFSNIDLDGIYMGWQGNVQDAVFEHIRSHRYGDLQDVNGGNIGGIGKWFAPPHLFYLNYAVTGDPALFNRNISISDVEDNGPRVGAARDKTAVNESGYASSLKIGCNQCSVNGYTTSRLDGLMDVLPSDGLTISNVVASYDSSFLNNLYPAWRFPTTGYKNITFDTVSLTDNAKTSIQVPIGSAWASSNENIVMSNIHVTMNRWAGAGSPIANIAGSDADIALDYVSLEDSSRIAVTEKGTVSAILHASPINVHTGGNTQLTWESKDASTCSATGAWAGTVATAGSQANSLISLGNASFSIECRNTNYSAKSTVVAVVDQ